MISISDIKWGSIVLILMVAIIAGAYPFFKKWSEKPITNIIGEAIASGIFLGAGLIHLLPDATLTFFQLKFKYPYASVIAGATFIFFLALEHILREMGYDNKNNTKAFAIIAFLMLSIHSFIAGSALGLSNDSSIIFLILIAILAHKWAASYALSLQINKSDLSLKHGVLLYVTFCFMTPTGILFSSNILNDVPSKYLLGAIFNAIAAGTFIYLGTLHGLSRSFMVKHCCNIKNFIFVILGFTIMAAVAIWT